MIDASRQRVSIAHAVRRALLIGAGAGFALCNLPAQAQQANNNTDTGTLQEVVVTGSYLHRTDTETPSPVQVVTAEELHQSGYTSTQQVLENLTANGQGTLSQGFSGAFASGAAGIALRGLNVGATLTLIDGHRTAPYPIGDDGQRSFVDVANLPFDAIERIDVLKDGASATYGSDAIAGVINIILKKAYQGAELTADGGITNHGDGTQVHFSGIWGVGDLEGDGHNGYISAEYRKQNVIRGVDRGGIFTQTDFTSTGGENLLQGTQNDVSGGLPRSATGYVTDSSGNIVGFMPGCNATTFAAGTCNYRDNWDEIQPPTENINAVARFTQKFGNTWTGVFEGGFFESKSEAIVGPGRAFTGGFQGVAFGPGIGPTLLTPVGATTIPDTNPTFPAGTGLTVGNLRNTFLNIGIADTKTDAKSYRAVFDLDGSLLGFDTSFSVGYTEVALDLDGINFVNSLNLQTALDSTTAPFLVGQANSAAVNNFVAPPLHTADTSKLTFAHLGFTRGLFDLPGGPFGLAFGSDWFVRDQFAVAPADVQAGFIGNFSNNFTIGTQHVESGYLEIDAPVVKQLDIDAAIRYDSYNLSGGKASPKIGFKYTPFEQLAIRGTASKGFRAPGPAENGRAGQSFFAGASPDPILCPNPGTPTAAGNFVGQCSVGIPGLQTTNPNLKPETSKSFSLGVIVEPIKNLSATFDIWSVEIDNQIVSGGPSTTVRGNNLTPLPQYQADGSTLLVAPPVAPIAYNSISFINANTTKTNGFDLALDFKYDFGFLHYQSKATWSYTNKYDLTIAGTTYQLAGTHGPFFYSGDTGNPKQRVQWSNTIGQEAWSVTGTLNYISAFSDTDPSSIAFGQPDQGTCLAALQASNSAGLDYLNALSAGNIPPNVSCSVAHFITYDLYGRFDVTKHLNIHGSVLNVFNEKAPLDWGTYGGSGGAYGFAPYNPSLHLQGAIGMTFTLGATYKF